MYTNAGTLEFLMDKEGRFYFLEMNTRIQVEHTVTEEITGFDIVKEQIRIAANQKLSYTQSEITVNSYAMECRVYAEDVFHGFLPSAGKISYYNQPVSSGLRIEAAVDGSVEISPDFDPLIAKVIVTGNSREEVIGRMENVLAGYIIHGIKTNIDYLKEVLGNPHFIANQVSTNFCIHHQDEFIAAFNHRVSAVPIKEIAAALLTFHYTIPYKDVLQNPVWYTLGYWRQTMNAAFEISGQRYVVTFQKLNSNQFICAMHGEHFEFSSTRNGHAILVYIDGKTCRIYVSENKENNFITIDNVTLILPKINEIALNKSLSKNISEMHSGNNLLSSLFGKVVRINCKPKDQVKKGEVILVIESIKIENNIIASKEGCVEQILVNMGDKVASGELLAVLSKK
jgi:3-methylcrotonyl-CoA carboxylase alpha subunit